MQRERKVGGEAKQAVCEEGGRTGLLWIMGIMAVLKGVPAVFEPAASITETAARTQCHTVSVSTPHHRKACSMLRQRQELLKGPELIVSKRNQTDFGLHFTHKFTVAAEVSEVFRRPVTARRDP